MLPHRSAIFGVAGARLSKSHHRRQVSFIPEPATRASLAHNRVAVAVGVLDAFDQFHEIIAAGSYVPTYGRASFESAFNSTTILRLGIAQRQTFHPPLLLGNLGLQGIAPAPAGCAKADVTIWLNDITGGKAVVYDRSSKEKAECHFTLVIPGTERTFFL
ncbi:hypothetical protein Tdes44962_MAKER03044 [Teratosphaeria destructans]|uniref:Uncharacterized protein n=1 Tax=Teratosphaeria destructans TaxID=418781 RepID=A0A9W7SRY6_9PEZI|nr:hypothetical protein Tdes44962_MAKER03044 [Teratosphaeria destructans]